MIEEEEQRTSSARIPDGPEAITDPSALARRDVELAMAINVIDEEKLLAARAARRQRTEERAERRRRARAEAESVLPPSPLEIFNSAAEEPPLPDALSWSEDRETQVDIESIAPLTPNESPLLGEHVQTPGAYRESGTEGRSTGSAAADQYDSTANVSIPTGPTYYPVEAHLVESVTTREEEEIIRPVDAHPVDVRALNVRPDVDVEVGNQRARKYRRLFLCSFVSVLGLLIALAIVLALSSGSGSSTRNADQVQQYPASTPTTKSQTSPTTSYLRPTSPSTKSPFPTTDGTTTTYPTKPSKTPPTASTVPTTPTTTMPPTLPHYTNSITTPTTTTATPSTSTPSTLSTITSRPTNPPTTSEVTTASTTTSTPTTLEPTQPPTTPPVPTVVPTSSTPTNPLPTTPLPTTLLPTTPLTTPQTTTVSPTTLPPTTPLPTEPATTQRATTSEPTTSFPTTMSPTTPAPTTPAPTTPPPTRHYSWVQVGIDIDGPKKGAEFGWSASFSDNGTRFASGAPGYKKNQLDKRGLVRIFEEEGGNWTQIGSDLLACDSFCWSVSYDLFGQSVSMSGDGKRVAVGANGYYDDTKGVSAGQTKVFEYLSGSWVLLGIPIIGEADGDYSGTSVSLSFDGNIVAIGAEYNDGTNGIDSGQVRVYEFVSNVWTQMGDDIDGEAADDSSGWSVSLSDDGHTVAIGAPCNDGINGPNSGHTRVYKYEGDSWTQLGQDLDGEDEYDMSGYSVSLSAEGNVVAVGAPYNDGVNGDKSGHVRVHEYNSETNSWSQIGNDIDGEAAGDEFGNSVSLASDGSVVAVGAYLNDGNGSNSGHVRIYILDNNAWVQVGDDIDGESAGEYSGSSVSLSGDGNRVLIGAPGNDDNGSGSGQVRVYELVAT